MPQPRQSMYVLAKETMTDTVQCAMV